MNNMKSLMPELTSLLIKIAPKLAKGKSFKGLWDKIKPESIDYGLLEKSKNIYVVTANFKWNDVEFKGASLNQEFSITLK